MVKAIKNIELVRGAHIASCRTFYTHHGLYLGDNQVLHYVDHKGIDITSLEDFTKGNELSIIEHINAKYTPQEAIERGLSRIGEEAYNILFNNCEHFVNWCIEGKSTSSQVNKITLTLGALGATALLYHKGKKRLAKSSLKIAKDNLSSYIKEHKILNQLKKN